MTGPSAKEEQRERRELPGSTTTTTQGLPPTSSAANLCRGQTLHPADIAILRRHPVAMNESNVVRLMSAAERFRERLMTARAILRIAIDSPIDDDLLRLVRDVADDLRKAVTNYREGN